MADETGLAQASSSSPVETPKRPVLPPELQPWLQADGALLFVIECISDLLQALSQLPATEAKSLRQVAPAASNLFTRATVLRNVIAGLVTFKAEAIAEGLAPSLIGEAHPFPQTATVAELAAQHTDQPGDVAPTHDNNPRASEAPPTDEAAPVQQRTAAPLARCWFCAAKVTKGNEAKCWQCGSANPSGPNPLTRKKTA